MHTQPHRFPWLVGVILSYRGDRLCDPSCQICSQNGSQPQMAVALLRFKHAKTMTIGRTLSVVPLGHSRYLAMLLAMLKKTYCGWPIINLLDNLVWPVDHFVSLCRNSLCFVHKHVLCEMLRCFKAAKLYLTPLKSMAFTCHLSVKRSSSLLQSHDTAGQSKDMRKLSTWWLVVVITWLCGYMTITLYAISLDVCTIKRNISVKCVEAPLNSTYHLRQL